MNMFVPSVFFLPIDNFTLENGNSIMLSPTGKIGKFVYERQNI